MDYGTLTSSATTAGSIANWLNTAQLVGAAPTIVAEAESLVYRRLRHWRMQIEMTGAMVIGQDYIPLPDTASTPFLEAKSLYITGVNFAKLTMETEEEVKRLYSYDGSGNKVNQTPRFYYQAFISGVPAAKLDSPADQTYPYELVYYQQPAPLSTTITNFLTVLYPRLFRCACMAGASEFMKDVGAGNYDRTYWEQLVESEILLAQAESDRGKRATEAGMILQ